MQHPNKPQLDEATLKTIKNNILNLIDRTNVAFKGKAPYVIADQDSLTTDEIIFKAWHLGMLEIVNLITDKIHSQKALEQPRSNTKHEPLYIDEMYIKMYHLYQRHNLELEDMYANHQMYVRMRAAKSGMKISEEVIKKYSI